jgi:hypothetical protein
MDIGREVTAIFHRHGIHSGTVQPEVVDDAASGTESDKTCLITCPSEALGVDTCARKRRLHRSPILTLTDDSLVALSGTLAPIREH